MEQYLLGSGSRFPRANNVHRSTHGAPRATHDAPTPTNNHQTTTVRLQNAALSMALRFRNNTSTPLSVAPKSIPRPTEKDSRNHINRLSPELIIYMLWNLSYQDLTQAEKVSKRWSSAVQALKSHHNGIIQTQYAHENSLFGARKFNGWLVPCKETLRSNLKYDLGASAKFLKDSVLHNAFLEDPFRGWARNYYMLGPDYLRFLHAYRTVMQQLCALFNRFIKKAQPGLELDQDVLYKVLLVWNTVHWRGHKYYPVPVLSHSRDKDGEVLTEVTLDFLPESLLRYLWKPCRLDGKFTRFSYEECMGAPFLIW